MNVKTLNEIFFTIIDRNSDQVLTHKQSGMWVPVSSKELYRNVVGTARALQRWGLQKGDRAAILSENRPEWAVADFATMLIGGVVVPIYTTLTAEQIGRLLRDAGVRVIFLSTAEQLEKVRSIQDQTHVEKIVVMEEVPGAGAEHMQAIMHAGPAGRDPQFDAYARAIESTDIATIIYTSGTTGQQKGAILTHGNLAANISVSMDEFPVEPAEERYISFLPLSHVTARHVDYAMYHHGITVTYQPDINKLMETLQEVRPTIFVAIPRVYEKIRHGVEHKAASGLKRSTYTWAMKIGRQHRETILRGETPRSAEWFLANRLFFRKIHGALGGRVRCFISGGAPLGRESAEWYADIGIRIHEGYGLTETSPVITINTPAQHRLGSVGRLLSNVQVRIAEDGEILVRGPSVFGGYWNRPEETANAFEGEWFRTGDIGQLDTEGFLFITDRKKDLIKTSGGKFIAPQPIESAFKNHELIMEAAVLGDRRKFPAVLLRPDFERLEAWARGKDIRFEEHDDLIRHPVVLALYEGLLNEVNSKLAQYEKMKKFILIPENFTVANGFLTPTLKIRRSAIEERYKGEIEALYADTSTSLDSKQNGGVRSW